jgi:tetratricopeptide (TPR) repeat protein
MRRAYVLSVLGRHAEALDDLRASLRGIRRSADPVWEARALNNRANVHLALGAFVRAERDLAAARALFRSTGQQLEEVHALHNSGIVAFRKGDMPTTLALLDQAAGRYAELGVNLPELAIDRCLAFLAAGMPQDAEEAVRAALEERSVQPARRAELLLMLASAALANGDARRALENAQVARRLFDRQQRSWWELQAELTCVRAQFALSPGGRRQLETAVSVGHRLAEAHADEAPLAFILAGRLASRQGLDSWQELLGLAARYRDRGPALLRATGWLARALSCETAGNSRGVLLACSRGLQALDEHQATLGSTELRALATAHGRELAEIAVRTASRRGARSLFLWSERWRATALSLPPVRTSGDARLSADLAALRETVRRLEQSRQDGAPSRALERERSRLERSIRSERLHAAGVGREAPPVDLDRIMHALDETTLVELVNVDGTLHAVVVAHGRVRGFAVGPLTAAERVAEQSRFALRRAAHGRPMSLASVGSRLESVLFGPAARTVRGDGPVVVCPPSRLQATPWALLPVLGERPFSVSPSAAAWVRARQGRGKQRSDVVLIGGPGLPAGGRELLGLVEQRPGAVVLEGRSATVDRSLEAMTGASLVHIVAHGHFRRDNPMFSCVELADGALTVHDLERAATAPRHLILSACDSGVMAPVGADELIGLSSALLSLGTGGVVSSVTEVNDAATCTFMVDLHEALLRTTSVAEAVLAARRGARGDLVSEATAASFLPFGA